VGVARDHHAVGWLAATFYTRLANPLRARLVNRRLASDYLGERELARLDYVFVPLHTEPEVTVLVYSPAWRNQIEVVRALAHAVPVGTQVVVKEHPASVGKRPFGYYRKLLEIPNVRLADPALPSRLLIEGARLVATVAGSIGLEALLRRKPVLTFGATPYGYLPASMTRKVGALETLPAELDALLRDHACDEEALVAFVAATLHESAPVNLYSSLLGKRDVYVPEGVSGWDEAVQALAAYTASSLTALGAESVMRPPGV